MASLDELLNAPSEPMLLAAREVLAGRTASAQAGIQEAAVEGILMTLPELQPSYIQVYMSQRVVQAIGQAAEEP